MEYYLTYFCRYTEFNTYTLKKEELTLLSTLLSYATCSLQWQFPVLQLPHSQSSFALWQPHAQPSWHLQVPSLQLPHSQFSTASWQWQWCSHSHLFILISPFGFIYFNFIPVITVKSIDFRLKETFRFINKKH